MCYRYNLHVGALDLKKQLDTDKFYGQTCWKPNSNIDCKSGAKIPVLLVNQNGEKEIRIMNWGINVKSYPKSFTMYNARCEPEYIFSKNKTTKELLEKSHCRCIVPMSGFYHWDTLIIHGHSYNKKELQPFYIKSLNSLNSLNSLLFVAGIYKKEKTFHGFKFSVTILTQEIVKSIKTFGLNNMIRMPKCLSPFDKTRWLSPTFSAFKIIKSPKEADRVVFHPPIKIGRWIDDLNNQDNGVLRSPQDWQLYLDEKMAGLNELSANDFDKIVSESIEKSKNIKRMRLNASFKKNNKFYQNQNKVIKKFEDISNNDFKLNKDEEKEKEKDEEEKEKEKDYQKDYEKGLDKHKDKSNDKDVLDISQPHDEDIDDDDDDQDVILSDNDDGANTSFDVN